MVKVIDTKLQDAKIIETDVLVIIVVFSRKHIQSKNLSKPGSILISLKTTNHFQLNQVS